MSILLLVKIAVVLPVMFSALPGTLCIWNWLANVIAKNRNASGSINTETEKTINRQLIFKTEFPKMAATDF